MNRSDSDAARLSRRAFVGGAASATVLGLSGCMGVLGGGGGDGGGLFDRIEMQPDGTILVGYDHDALDSDDKDAITRVVLLDGDGEQLDAHRYSPYDDTVDVKPFAAAFSNSHLVYGEHRLEARDDFGDAFAETTVDYTTDVSVSQITHRGPNREPRDDAENYDPREGNLWSQSEVEIQFENAGPAPAYVSDLTFEGVQDAMPGIRFSKSARGEWSSDTRNVVPNDSEATVTTTFDHGEQTEDGERAFPCGDSYDTNLTVVVGNGHEEIEVPVTLHFQGDQHEQFIVLHQEPKQYCEDFDVEQR